MSCQSTIDIFNAPVPFEEPAEFEGSEGDMPNALVDLLEADIFPNTGV